MTSEEAIEFIAQSVKSNIDMAKVADAIKALKQEARWIPVSERLPDDGETVIASVDGEYVYSEARYSKEFGWEWAAESSYDYWTDLNGVDAWMPLPKAYKPESEEKDGN